MDAKTKFKLKRRIKIYTTLSWSMLAFFFMFFILIASSGKIFDKPLAGVIGGIINKDADSPVVLIIALSFILIPIFSALIFTMMSSMSRIRLQAYKSGIKLYRTCKFGTEILNYIQANELDKAIDMYKKFDLGFDKRLDNYVYGILLGACYNSKSEALWEIAEKKINKLKETYNPDKILISNV